MARRGSGAYLSDSISRLNPNFAHSSNRPQYYTYMRVLMTSTFLSHQCAESYPKNRGLLNRTVIQNNGKFLPLLRLHGTTAAPRRGTIAAATMQKSLSLVQRIPNIII